MENKQSSSGDLSARQQKYELKIQQESLHRDKKTADRFLEQPVPEFLLGRLKELRKELAVRAQKLKQKHPKLSFQERTELKNIQWLQKSFSRLRALKYWQLLKILHKFPKHLQIGIDDNLGQYLTDHPGTRELKRIIIVTRYVAERTSLQRFLTDCYILSKLRGQQLKEMGRLKPGESPIARSFQLEEELGIIPSHFVLEKRMGGNNMIGIFQGKDLSNDISIIIKYLTQNPEKESLSKSQIRNMGVGEARRRFEREAHAFEKLEKHRQSKEKEMLKMLADAKQKIEEATQEENYEKMKEGFELFKKGELMCDRHFIKAYCLATGKLHRFSTTEKGFFVRQPGENVAFMVMEYLSGKSLEEFIAEHRKEKKQIPLPSVVSIVSGVLQALDYCHEEGIIHRDVSPANILLNEDQKVRLTNLGLAKVEDMTQLTAQGALIGTPGYAAPEGFAQGADYKRDFSHLIAATDHRFDIYSTGCVAYEMLLLRPPFMSDEKDPEKRDQDLILKHFQEEPIPPKRFRQEISEDLNRVVMTMLCKRPKERFRTAYDAMVALNATMSGGGEIIQKLLHKIGRKKRIRHGRRTAVWPKVACAVLVAFIAFAAVYLFWDTGNSDGAYSQTAKDAGKILRELRESHSNLYKQWQQVKSLKENYQRQFPSEDDYPVIGPSIGKLLKKSRDSVVELSAFIDAQEKKLGDKDPDRLLARLKDYRQDFAYKDKLEVLERTREKIKSKEALAAQIKKTRKNEERVRHIARLLKTYLFAAEQEFSSIDSKLAILERDYPTSKGYWPAPPKDLEKLKKFRKQAGEIESVVDKINAALLADDLVEAEKCTIPYREFSLSSLDRLADVEESVSDVLGSCRKRYRDRERERRILQGSIMLKARYDKIANYLPKARQSWKRLSLMPAAERPQDKLFKEPEKLFKMAEQEMNRLRSERLTLEQVDRKDAVALVKPYLAGKISTVSDRLKMFDERAGFQVKIARMTGQKKKLKQQVIKLHGETERRLKNLATSYSRWRQVVEDLQKEFPKLKASRSRKIARYDKKAQSVKNSLFSVVAAAKKQIDSENLQAAYKTLSGREKLISDANSVVKALKKDRRRRGKTLVKARKKQRNRAEISRCEKTIDKLEKHIAHLSKYITPLQREIARIVKAYPKQKGYPQIGRRSRQTVEKAQKEMRNYQRVIAKAKNCLKEKNVAKALDLLKSYEEGKLSSRALVEDFGHVQEDIAQTIKSAEKYKGNRKQIDEIDGLIDEIRGRKTELQATLPALREKITEFGAYSKQLKIDPPDSNTSSYIDDAQREVELLQSLIEEGENLALEKHYGEALAELRPFSRKINKDISVLPVIRSSNKLYGKMLKTLRDPQERKRMLAKKQAEAEKQAKLKQLESPPGDWYLEVKRQMEHYRLLQDNIAALIGGDKGSTYVYSRIHINWIKIAEYPSSMAELKIMLQEIEKKGGAIPADPENFNEIKLLEYYNSGKINIDAQEDIERIKKSLGQVEREIRSKWVQEDTLRKILRAQNDLVRKFDDYYQCVNSELSNRN